MLDAFQWGGFVSLIVGYWFLKSPTVSAVFTLLGCISILIWAFAMGAWGIAALEVAVGAIACRNIVNG